MIVSNKIRVALFIAASVIFLACEKEETIGQANYYISTTTSSNYNTLSLKFEKLSIQLLEFDAMPYLITNQAQSIEFNLSNPQPIYLGSQRNSFQSLKRDGSPNKYEIWFSSSDYRLKTDTSEMSLNHLIDINSTDFLRHDTVHAYIAPENKLDVTILLEINIENSVILDSAGKSWIAPDINLIKK
tara:strand:- start:7889 stop:8446 length:558 start_codon:yes stop_codon:yes gene_type:complete